MPPRLPHDAAGWARLLAAPDIPVLRRTAQQLAQWRELEDAVDVRALEEVIVGDPLMTLKLLAHTSQQHRRRRQTDVETVRQALVLLGITPFFKALGEPPCVEDLLTDRPEALAGLRAVVARSRLAARYALGFAAHRLDPDAGLLCEAAALHDLAEMLLWCHAPDAALALAARQRQEPTARSRPLQRELLGATLVDVQRLLMAQWQLPELLIRVTADHDDAGLQERLVTLAVRLARHTAQGWDNPALPSDLAAIASLLNLGVGPTCRLVKDLAEA